MYECARQVDEDRVNERDCRSEHDLMNHFRMQFRLNRGYEIRQRTNAKAHRRDKPSLFAGDASSKRQTSDEGRENVGNWGKPCRKQGEELHLVRSERKHDGVIAIVAIRQNENHLERRRRRNQPGALDCSKRKASANTAADILLEIIARTTRSLPSPVNTTRMVKYRPTMGYERSHHRKGNVLHSACSF